MSLNQPTLEILSVDVLGATILCFPEIMALDNILINIVYLGDGQMSFATSDMCERSEVWKTEF